MLKKYLLIIPLFFLFNGVSSAEERIVVSTYYPSPYGSYRDLDTNQMRIGSFYTQQPTAAPANGLIVQGQVGIGTTVPSAGYMLEVQGNQYVNGYYNSPGDVYARNYYIYALGNWITNLIGAPPHSSALYACPTNPWGYGCGNCVGQVSTSSTCDAQYDYGIAYGWGYSYCASIGYIMGCSFIGYTVP